MKNKNLYAGVAAGFVSGKVVKSFEPYANLWTTAANWRVWQTEWNDGSFQSLDPEEMEKELGPLPLQLEAESETIASRPIAGRWVWQVG